MKDSELIIRVLKGKRDPNGSPLRPKLVVALSSFTLNEINQSDPDLVTSFYKLDVVTDSRIDSDDRRQVFGFYDTPQVRDHLQRIEAWSDIIAVFEWIPLTGQYVLAKLGPNRYVLGDDHRCTFGWFLGRNLLSACSQ